MFTTLLEKVREIPGAIPEAIGSLFENPVSLVVLIVLLVALVMIVRFSKIQFSARLMAQIGLAVAIATVLDMMILFRMPQGGSVTVASMVPIYLIAFAYGPQVGLFTGFLFGLVNLLLGAYIMHPIQTLLDYPVPFMMIGLAGAFPKHMNVGIVSANVLRFICHVLSGVIFFASYAPEGQHPLIYSMLYNSFVFVDGLIALVVMNVLPVNRLVKTINKQAPSISR